MALLGQLLVHIPPHDADRIVRLSQTLPPTQEAESSNQTASQGDTKERPTEVPFEKTEEGKEEDTTEGAATVDFLFDLGASCLEKWVAVTTRGQFHRAAISAASCRAKKIIRMWCVVNYTMPTRSRCAISLGSLSGPILQDVKVEH